jgi:hypothetical protein
MIKIHYVFDSEQGNGESLGPIQAILLNKHESFSVLDVFGIAS